MGHVLGLRAEAADVHHSLGAVHQGWGIAALGGGQLVEGVEVAVQGQRRGQLQLDVVELGGRQLGAEGGGAEGRRSGCDVPRAEELILEQGRGGLDRLSLHLVDGVLKLALAELGLEAGVLLVEATGVEGVLQVRGVLFVELADAVRVSNVDARLDHREGHLVGLLAATVDVYGREEVGVLLELGEHRLTLDSGVELLRGVAGSRLLEDGRLVEGQLLLVFDALEVLCDEGLRHAVASDADGLGEVS